MARARMISKSFSTSKKRALLHTTAPELAEFCQALYPLLVVHADDWGRLPGDAFTVKLAIDPSSPRSEADFDRGLDALHAVGLIQRYQSEDGTPLIAIVNFDPHQSGLHRRTPSKLPPPNGAGNLPPSPGFPGNSGNFPTRRGGSVNFPLKRREQNRTKERKNAARPPQRSRANDPKVSILAAMIREDVLPLRLPELDLPEASKSRAAVLRLAYDSRAIGSAIESAQAQRTKRRRA